MVATEASEEEGMVEGMAMSNVAARQGLRRQTRT